MGSAPHSWEDASGHPHAFLLALLLVTTACPGAGSSREAAAVSEARSPVAAPPLLADSPDHGPEAGSSTDLAQQKADIIRERAPRGVPEAEDRASGRPADPGSPGPVTTRDEPGSATRTEIASSEPAVLEGCRERYVIAPGIEEEVRPRVPEQFTLRHNLNGQPLLYITAIHCQRYTVNGVTRPTTAAAFAVSIESPDGVMCATPWPVLGTLKPDLAGSCNNYLLFAAYDNPAVVAWARAGTPDAPVHYVRNLVFDEGDFDPASIGVPLHFDSGSTPSRYKMDLVVRERPVTLPLAAAFWFESAIGTVRVGFDTSAIALGEASGRVTVEPGSNMARMLGTTAPSAQQPFPLLAGNRWDQATLTKTVDRPRPRP